MRARLLRLALAALTCGPAGLALAACQPAEVQVATVELELGGMVCESCAHAIAAAVEKKDGVRACRVLLRPAPAGQPGVAGRATVEYDPARIDAAAISAAISALGYTATPA